MTPSATRRAFVSTFPALGLAFWSQGCRSAPVATTPSWPRTTEHDGVQMIELFPGGSDETSPLVVAVHGMGDRPDRWIDDWKTFPAKVQIALPRAFEPYGDGFSWFAFKDGMTDEQFGAAVGAAEARLWRGIAHLAKNRRVIVTGFSQGGILSFAMAARHANEIVHAFPVAGACPGPILPKSGTRAAPVLAFHGTEDQVLQIKWSRETVHAFTESGNTAELREYPGVGHQLPPAIRKDLWDAIQMALAGS
jgi:phospholipase/carboxylesterase